MVTHKLTDEDVKILREMRGMVSELRDLLRNSRGLNVGAALSVNRQPPITQQSPTNGDPGRWFRITSSSQDGSNMRWVYSMAEIYKSGAGYNAWTDVPSGVATTKGYNGIEDQNAATGTYGVNIASTNLSGTFALKPLYTGARVRAWPIANTSNDVEWWFTASNAVDGGC